MEEAVAIPNLLDTTRAWLGRLDLRRRLMGLPLPLQILLTFSFSQLFALTIAIPDLIPLVDEAIAGWLFYVGIMATAGTVRTRYGPRIAAWRRRLGRAKGSDAVLVQASLLEVEDLG
jgi:hypothetical protein